MLTKAHFHNAMKKQDHHEKNQYNHTDLSKVIHIYLK